MVSLYCWQFWLVTALILLFLIWVGRDYLSHLLPREKGEITSVSQHHQMTPSAAEQSCSNFKYCPHCGGNLQSLEQLRDNYTPTSPREYGGEFQPLGSTNSPLRTTRGATSPKYSQSAHTSSPRGSRSPVRRSAAPSPGSSKHHGAGDDIAEVIEPSFSTLSIGGARGNSAVKSAPTYTRHQKIDLTPALPQIILEDREERIATPPSTAHSRREAAIAREISNTTPPQSPRNISQVTRHDDGISGLGSAAEEECRRIFEKIYNAPFPRRRPSWLVNNLTGRRMELDGYCEMHNIAFEYNGEQHYKSDHPFNRSHQAFLDQVHRDNLKVELCDIRGVYLLTIPYNVPYNKLEKYIRYYLPEAVAAREVR